MLSFHSGLSRAGLSSSGGLIRVGASALCQEEEAVPILQNE